jgi:hypothetical protein
MLCIAGKEPGGSADPGALVRGLAAAARAPDAEIHEHSRCRRSSPAPRPCSARGWSAPRRARDRRARRVCDEPRPATGPDHARPDAGAGDAPLSDGALGDMGLADRTPFYTADLPYLWGASSPTGAWCSARGSCIPPTATCGRCASAIRPCGRVLCRPRVAVRGLHPALARIAIRERWGGPIAFRRGAVPIVSPPSRGVTGHRLRRRTAGHGFRARCADRAAAQRRNRRRRGATGVGGDAGGERLVDLGAVCRRLVVEAADGQGRDDRRIQFPESGISRGLSGLSSTTTDQKLQGSEGAERPDRPLAVPARYSSTPVPATER